MFWDGLERFWIFRFLEKLLETLFWTIFHQFGTISDSFLAIFRKNIGKFFFGAPINDRNYRKNFSESLSGARNQKATWCKIFFLIFWFSDFQNHDFWFWFFLAFVLERFQLPGGATGHKKLKNDENHRKSLKPSLNYHIIIWKHLGRGFRPKWSDLAKS